MLDGRILRKLQPAVDILLEAHQFAIDTQSTPWDFAVSLKELRKLQVSDSDLRWLLKKGYVEHGREVTLPNDAARDFRKTESLLFYRRSCFVITDVGAEGLASDRHGDSSARDSTKGSGVTISKPTNGHAAMPPIVKWDANSRKLTIDGQLVKRFKWQAINQEMVLSAFQEEGWPERIDDPLPPQPEQDSKRRLSDTIKCLNRMQTNELIHFRGDGTGEGVVWELKRPSTNGHPKTNGNCSN